MTQGIRYAWTTAAAVALLLATSATWAQQPGQGRGRGGPPGGGFGGGGDNFFALLGNEKIQKELELLDEQKADLKKLGEDAQTKVREAFSSLNFREASEEERTKFREKAEAMAKDARKKLEEILIPDQVKRLKEISLQLRGTQALRDPEIVAALGITDEQKEAMDKVREDLGPKFREVFEANRGEGNREAIEKKMAELRKESSELILAVLKPGQREKYEKMKGEKFEIDPSEVRGLFGFGGGIPGGGGPGGNPGGGNQPRRRPGGDN